MGGQWASSSPASSWVAALAWHRQSIGIPASDAAGPGQCVAVVVVLSLALGAAVFVYLAWEQRLGGDWGLSA